MTVVVGGQGDIVDPNAWQDAAGNVPPQSVSAMFRYNVNYPLNGDGRYWFQTNAFADRTLAGRSLLSAIRVSISTGSVNLQWSVVQAANDGSTPQLVLSDHAAALGQRQRSRAPAAQLGGIQNGQIVVPLNTLTTVAKLKFQVYTTGGTSLSTAIDRIEIAVAITRNINEGLTWDSPNPFDPVRLQRGLHGQRGADRHDGIELTAAYSDAIGFRESSDESAAGHGVC